MYQARWRSEWRPSLSVISAAFIALGRSCLSAILIDARPEHCTSHCTYLLVGKDEQKSVSQFILAQHALHYVSASMLDLHSSRASVIRSLSFESTTKMMPWVFWKSDQYNSVP